MEDRQHQGGSAKDGHYLQSVANSERDLTDLELSLKWKWNYGDGRVRHGMAI